MARLIDVVNEWKVKGDSWVMTTKDGDSLWSIADNFKPHGTGCPGREN